MMLVEPFELLKPILDTAYGVHQIIVPVWLCVRFRYKGALVSIPFLWALRLFWLWALPAIDPQEDTNFAAALLLITGLPTCLVMAGIIFGLTTAVKAIIRKLRPAHADNRPFRLHLKLKSIVCL